MLSMCYCSSDLTLEIVYRFIWMEETKQPSTSPFLIPNMDNGRRVAFVP